MTMKTYWTLIAAAAAAMVAGGAQSAPTADEIKMLGTTLTPWGAEVAGNKDGTIPAYTGGMTKPPAKYDKKRPGWRPDPFADDKPLFSIDAKNMAQYADKLSPGTQEMLRKYPTYRVDVYPSHRSVAYPQQVIDNSLKNASRCGLINNGDGIDVSKGCWGGIPFPIAKSGYEILWNKNSHYGGSAQVYDAPSYYVKPNGEKVLTSDGPRYEEFGFYNEAKPEYYYLFRAENTAPARIVGQATMLYDLVANNERRAWAYQPATRRVRLAPDLAGDTPLAALGGAAVYDEVNMFQGSMDRFDMKLIGKKEMYIPYNAYKLAYADKGSGCTVAEGLLTANHVKSECVRWELHRVWHVQGTLKQGKRHIFSKRDFFLDEDSWHGGLADTYDAAGKLYHVYIGALSPLYEVPSAGIVPNYIVDLISGIYTFAQVDDQGYVVVSPLSASSLAPDSLSTFIVRVPK
ncbi:MAG: DUF1329 domain-containing protein [Gemmatimonadota bacterium]|nr:DUF1329 domain-containing protein [Gemmatimonadota bacterium]